MHLHVRRVQTRQQAMRPPEFSTNKNALQSNFIQLEAKKEFE